METITPNLLSAYDKKLKQYIATKDEEIRQSILSKKNIWIVSQENISYDTECVISINDSWRTASVNDYGMALLMIPFYREIRKNQIVSISYGLNRKKIYIAGREEYLSTDNIIGGNVFIDITNEQPIAINIANDEHSYCIKKTIGTPSSQKWIKMFTISNGNNHNNSISFDMFTPSDSNGLLYGKFALNMKNSGEGLFTCSGFDYNWNNMTFSGEDSPFCAVSYLDDDVFTTEVWMYSGTNLNGIPFIASNNGLSLAIGVIRYDCDDIAFTQSRFDSNNGETVYAKTAFNNYCQDKIKTQCKWTNIGLNADSIDDNVIRGLFS